MPDQVSNSDSVGTFLIVFFVLFILIIIFSSACYCSESCRSCFTNSKTEKNEMDLKSLDIILFVNPQCPHCVKTIELLKSKGELNNLELVDITTKQGNEIAGKYAGNGKMYVPLFISRKNNTGTMGYKNSIEEIIESLKPEVSNGQENKVSEKVLLFTTSTCGYCTKAKQSIKQNGLESYFKIIDVGTPEGNKMAKEWIKPGVNGVPVWVLIENKEKYVHGYKDPNEVLKELMG